MAAKPALVTVAVIVPFTEGFEDSAAWIVTVLGEGTLLGAAYVAAEPVPVGVIVPNVELPPAIPLTDHAKVGLAVPVTAAANCSVPPATTLPVGADTETLA